MCVPTFGYLRLIAYLQLPAAFRSLSRPSSAPNAKAFSICSSSLELLKYFNTFCISFDIHRFSSLELLCFILAVNIFRYSWQNCFFTLNRKTWFRFHDIFVFPFTFVCHVCHTNSFELICYKFLFGFQWTFRLTLFKLSFTVTWFTIKSLWRLICSSWAQVDSNHRPRAYQARALTSWAMSPQAASVVCIYDGDDGIRTLDPLLARQVLSQLSYTPIKMSASVFSMNFTACVVLDHW